MQAGQLFGTFHRPDLYLDQFTSSGRDRLVRTPEYKAAAVRAEKPAA